VLTIKKWVKYANLIEFITYLWSAIYVADILVSVVNWKVTVGVNNR